MELAVGRAGEGVAFADGGGTVGEVAAIGQVAEGRWHEEWSKRTLLKVPRIRWGMQKRLSKLLRF